MSPFVELAGGNGDYWRFTEFVQRAVEDTQDPFNSEEIQDHIMDNFHLRNVNDNFSLGEVKIWTVLNTPDEVFNRKCQMMHIFMSA